jgi:cytochrome P450 family 4 subfamily V
VFKIFQNFYSQKFLSDGEKWAQRRRLITPTFHFDILKDFLNVMNEQTEILIGILSKQSKSDEVINILERLSASALDIICESAMGQHNDAQTKSENEYHKCKDITISHLDLTNIGFLV